MADDAEESRTCGRRGCGNIEQRGNPFLKCSRCKSTVYCSRECQREDYCKGHSACALKGVQAAAEDGPLTAGACKQVVIAACLLLHIWLSLHGASVGHLHR
jgi:hypothetical protein